MRRFRPHCTGARCLSCVWLTCAARCGGEPGKAHVHDKSAGCIQNVHLTPGEMHLPGAVVRMVAASRTPETRAAFALAVQHSQGGLLPLHQAAVAVRDGASPYPVWNRFMQDFRLNGIGLDILPSFLLAVVHRLLADGQDFHGHFAGLAEGLQQAMELGKIGYFKKGLMWVIKALQNVPPDEHRMLAVETCQHGTEAFKLTKFKFTVSEEYRGKAYTLLCSDDAPVFDAAHPLGAHHAPPRPPGVVINKTVLANETHVALCDGQHTAFVFPQYSHGITYVSTLDAAKALALERTVRRPPTAGEHQVRPRLSRDTGSVQ